MSIWRKCPRCDSDTCPGRDDILDCTARIDGLTARDEARSALRAGETSEAQARAWHAGWMAGFDDCSVLLRRGEDRSTPNPYREDA